jgi:folate-binding protein YgfZ
VYTLIVARDALDAARVALRTAGARDASIASLETLRVESGAPSWGVDMDENTLPQEANLDDMHAVSYTKGCYIGQETVARIHFRGHVNRNLRRLVFANGVEPPRGAVLQDDSHRNVGDVRSTARSELDGTIGIGMVRCEINDGETVEVHWEGGGTSAVITGKAKGAID